MERLPQVDKPAMTYEYVTLDRLKPFGWLGTALFAFAAVFALHAGQLIAAIGFTVLIPLGVYVLVLAYSYFRVDETAIESVSARGKRSRIAWQDVRWLECGRQGSLVFHGEKKRLVLLPAGYWSGPYAVRTHRRLVGEIERRGLEIKETRLGDYKWNRNVSVKPEANRPH